MIIFLFGEPGSGKNYIGEILEENFRFYFYDADIDLTNELKSAIKCNPLDITDCMRDDYYKKVYNRILSLSKKNKNIVVAQAFTKEKYRKIFKEYFPQANFLYITAPEKVRNCRLDQRNHFVKREEAAKLKKYYEKPILEHLKYINVNSREDTVKKFEQLLKNI